MDRPWLSGCPQPDRIIGATLRAAHGQEVETSLSRDHPGHEPDRVRGGLEVAVEPEAWAVFSTPSRAAMATWLLETAAKPTCAATRRPAAGPEATGQTARRSGNANGVDGSAPGGAQGAGDTLNAIVCHP
ncbi:hypothetical protein [Plasticicumulans sp.]|uniref:hypothetical protein n=1 Tax=Plasticicumulans sp. TaxID=2307179 RepID=UPI002BBDA611|nr:hypothetical protein [Plasticicumulans sp.]HNM43857.1 hypothetical protein [Plasticicumulans sp.]